MVRRMSWVVVAGLALGLSVAPAAGQAFTFWQFSDLHSPVQGSREVVAAAADDGAVRLEPYGVQAQAPAFALATGDLTEFGPGDGAWERLVGYFAGFPCPVRFLPGNHDNTWWSLRPTLAAMGQPMPFAFEHQGCHFILLDSAGRQDPRPGFGVEELRWLEAYLQRVGPEAPLFVALHHPLEGSEWAGAYDYQRLLELLQPYNVALLLDGHGHSARTHKFGDFDGIMGGSTFDKNADGWAGGNAGYAVIDVRDGMLRAAYKRTGDDAALVPLLEKPLHRPAERPIPAFTSPPRLVPLTEDAVTAVVQFDGPAEATATVTLGDGEPVALQPSPQGWWAEVDVSELPPGRYVLRARFEHDGRVALASREFERAVPGAARLVWRRMVPTSVRGTPAVDGSHVFVAGQDGVLYALQRHGGGVAWRFATAGECYGGPAVAGDTVYVTSTDGHLYAVDRLGRERWRYDAGRPIVAPPAVAYDTVYFGAIDGTLHAVDALTGQRRWQVKGADYTIESAATVAEGTVYFGSWDTHVYAVDADSGDVRWRAVGQGSRREGAARYYSPANCPPAVAGQTVFAADRSYQMILLDRATGFSQGSVAQVGAVAADRARQTVYVRHYGQDGQKLARLRPDGTPQWIAPVPTGSLPVPPAEGDGVVVVTTSLGLLSALSPDDGRLLWQFQSQPGFYTPGGAVPFDGVVYTAALDGSVTAVAGP